MKPLFILFLAVWLLPCATAGAQSAKGTAIPITAEFPVSGGALLRWPKDTGFAAAVGYRRELQRSIDFEALDTSGGGNRPLITILNDTTAIDSGYRPGTQVEYYIKMVARYSGTRTYTRYGVVTVCQECEPMDDRGILILVTEKLVRDSLPAELAQLKQDLRMDGWRVRAVTVSDTQSVVSVKDSIRHIYYSDSTRVKMVYLLGHVPVPYSGSVAPDGHSQHMGAWPADGYYVTLNARYTDIGNNPSSRPENINLPRDGKFDQNVLSGPAYMGICRVDLWNLPVFLAANPQYTQLFLLRRYLQKAHRYKIGEYTGNHRGMMDDNFGYFGGEAFGASGWMNQYSCVGASNIREKPYDLLFDSRTRNWLMGYGCGGGGYEACLDVGNSRNFASDTVNIVFMQLFGSYFGDWDSQDNLMRSGLASRGGILTMSWSGRPWHYYHLMGAGVPYGETARINLFNPTFAGSGLYTSRHGQSRSIGFLGDPSLRLEYVKPPQQVRARQVLNRIVEVTWTPGLDTTVQGYHIYRGTHPDSLTRITQNPVQDTLYRDTVSMGRYYYKVRSLRAQAYPGGSYSNLSLGVVSDSVRVSFWVVSHPWQGSTLSLYPNPTTGQVRIHAGSPIQRVQVLDGLGRPVLAMPSNTPTLGLDLSAQPGGIYTIKVLSGEGWQVKRVVKI